MKLKSSTIQRNLLKLGCENIIPLENIKSASQNKDNFNINRDKLLQIYNYTYEDLKNTILPMCEKGEEPLSSMGVDAPLAVLSKEPQPLFNYFKQLFAQVTNPPIDAIREEIITSTTIYLGSSENLLGEIEENTQKSNLATPILTNEDLSKIRNIDNPNFKVKTINASYGKKDDEYDLELALDLLCQEAEKSILEGYNIINFK